MYLKSIAACVFLAHVGSFVPATSAFIPLVDRVFTRVGASRDGGGGAGGSFAADCARVSQMCNGCTGRSLCVVDEFGKGTATADGVGLLTGFLRFLARSPTPPIALVATHFTEFVRDESIVPTTMRPMQFLTMRIHLRRRVPRRRRRRWRRRRRRTRARKNQTAGKNRRESDERAAATGHPKHPKVIRPPGYRSAGEDDSVVFLYRAVPGVSSRAYSLRCARDAGLPGSVLARCEELAAIDAANGAGRRGEERGTHSCGPLGARGAAGGARSRGARDRAVARARLDPTCSFEGLGIARRSRETRRGGLGDPGPGEWGAARGVDDGAATRTTAMDATDLTGEERLSAGGDVRLDDAARTDVQPVVAVRAVHD